jgi:hypothetical protein
LKNLTAFLNFKFWMQFFFNFLTIFCKFPTQLTSQQKPVTYDWRSTEKFMFVFRKQWRQPRPLTLCRILSPDRKLASECWPSTLLWKCQIYKAN